jgi:GntR family transcriptional regulator/MocR family aminotransferase
VAWTIDRSVVHGGGAREPRYVRLAAAIEAAIAQGELCAGEQLPTVRALAGQTGISSASVAVAYGLLERRGMLRACVGRGTFVADAGAARPTRSEFASERASSTRVDAPSAQSTERWSATGVSEPSAASSDRRAATSTAAPSAHGPTLGGPSLTVGRAWRRRVLQSSDRLRGFNPEALRCNSSWPDPELLPFDLLKGAYAHVVASLQPRDLQYGGPEAHPELAQALLPWLAADGLDAQPSDLLAMSSFSQLLTVALEVAPAFLGVDRVSVAVEEPGYHAAFGLIERAGQRLIGVGSDEHGALPGSLLRALEAGADVAVLTPRGVNPTGASWTKRRREALADVLRQFPRTLIVEDDHFAGLAASSPGAVWSDALLRERSVYARSFSKSIAPDVRVTVALARGRLLALLREARLSNGGWAPRLGQRALAAVLADAALLEVFAGARAAYAERRETAAAAIVAAAPELGVAVPHDGLNVWVSLPAGCDAQDLVQHAAHVGVLVSSGEAFFVQPGRRDAVRLSIGRVDTSGARRAGELLARAALTLDDVPLSLVV